MQRQDVERRLAAIMEELAGLEHERWALWQSHVHRKAQRLPDGSLLLAPELVRRWEAQIAQPYAELPESDKERDRLEVRRYLPLIISSLSR